MPPSLEYNEPLEIKKANDAINRFVKAVDDPVGEAELRVFYVECGNNFTLSYGDIDEDFYETVLNMYEYAIETVLETPPEKKRISKKAEGRYGLGISNRLGIR